MCVWGKLIRLLKMIMIDMDGRLEGVRDGYDILVGWINGFTANPIIHPLL
jgi:hypothetical protein